MTLQPGATGVCFNVSIVDDLVGPQVFLGDGNLLTESDRDVEEVSFFYLNSSPPVAVDESNFRHTLSILDNDRKCIHIV